MNSWFSPFSFDGPSESTHSVSKRSPATPAAAIVEPIALTSERPLTTFEERQAMTRRRSEALRAMFPKLFTWFASRWDFDTVSEVNTYLEQSTNLADLELRIRHLEQKRHFGS